MELHTENEAYASLLCGHLEGMIYRLRQMPEDKWDWRPADASPTARILAAHAWQWLICDRQHLEQPDASLHLPIAEPPSDPVAMCDALQVETDHWRKLIMRCSADDFASPRKQFNLDEARMNVRSFVCHMIQNCIYKHGQLSTLYFALGFDGTEPYSAPFPNPIYAEIFGQRANS